jgi:hypothetical protein
VSVSPANSYRSIVKQLIVRSDPRPNPSESDRPLAYDALTQEIPLTLVVVRPRRLYFTSA